MSLKKIHQICLILEGIQVVSSVLVLLMGFYIRPLHLYASMIYFFTAVFAHVVVYYVLRAIGNNVRDAFVANPNSVHEWLVFATGRLSSQALPFIVAHLSVLLALLGLAAAHGLSGAQPKAHLFGALLAAVAGVACLVRVVYLLKDNALYLTSFVTSGGFASTRPEAIDQ